MKIRLVLFFFISAIISLSSCTKTWDCECSERGKVLQVTEVSTVGKWGAKSICDTYQDENNRVLGTNMICVIK